MTAPKPDPAGPPGFAVEDWGLLPYPEALHRQNERVAQRLAATIPDTLALTEHPPVFTIGRRRGASDNVLFSAAELIREGISVCTTSRGGDVTYHGPGQLVGYLFVDLSNTKDLHSFLRLVEACLLRSLNSLGLLASTRPGLTGIWIEKRKVAAIGFAARQWVSFHGFAINIEPNLKHFQGIVPCGITDGTVTSLAHEISPCPTRQSVIEAVSFEFSKAFPLATA
ncbi:MAG: lipoyl(octanoyl) transferase LipB [Puniceicoccaceae bacterium]